MEKNSINQEKTIYLNELVSLINANQDTKEFYLKNKAKFNYISPQEVFSIEKFSKNADDIARIKEIAGKVVNLLRTGLLNYKWNKNISLIQKLYNEANAIRDKFSRFKTYIKDNNLDSLKKELNITHELKKRFLKMQNVIFSNLETRLKNNKPLKVMWSLHDDALMLHKSLENDLNNNAIDINVTIGKYFFLVLGILEKEELLILPLLADNLSLLEFEKLEAEVDSYGYAFISDAKEEDNVFFKQKDDEYLFNSNNGKLNLDELISILNCVGDITFVDSENKVKFFNAPHQHFSRSSSIIGRDVRNCHPSKSIQIVSEIINRFKNEAEDRVDFWLNIQDKLILISYFAIRNQNNKYLGVMELTQDITNIAKITGERRILDYSKK